MIYRNPGLWGVLFITLLVVFLGGCSNDQVEKPIASHVHEDGTAHEGDTTNEPAPVEAESHDGCIMVVHLDEKASANLNLKTQTIALEPWFDRIKIPGVVDVDPDRLVHVSLPATVRVLELNAPLHSTVRAGQQLAVLELVDPEINQLQIRAVELRAELLETQTELGRTRNYLSALPAANSDGNDPERRRVEANLAVIEARSNSMENSLGAVLETLKISGLGDDQLKRLAEHGKVTTRISIFAPSLPGAPALEVAVRSVDMGETVPAGTTIFKLVAMDHLLVIGDAFESDLPVVSVAARENLPVSLLFPAENRHVNQLTILTVESALDGIERITHFLVPVPNQLVSEKVVGGVKYCDWALRAGAQVQILVATNEVGPRFVLPSSAIVRDGGNIVVFRKISDGYERVEILLERLEGRNAVLTQGSSLTEGDLIVTNGALQLNLILKSQSGGEAAANDHGHTH